MKCIMRTFSCLQALVIPSLASLLPILTQKLHEAAKNPTRPHFNHYLFEALSLSIRIVCASQPEAVTNFETVLFPVFQSILTEDVQEFVPYVFQILSLLLEVHTPGNIPQPYMELFQFLLIPILWERPGNIKPLVRLIQAYIRIGSGQVVGKVEALLGVFQKLIASKSNDHEGFYLLQSMIEFMPKDVMGNYNKGIFQVRNRLIFHTQTKYQNNFFSAPVSTPQFLENDKVCQVVLGLHFLVFRPLWRRHFTTIMRLHPTQYFWNGHGTLGHTGSTKSLGTDGEKDLRCWHDQVALRDYMPPFRCLFSVLASNPPNFGWIL